MKKFAYTQPEAEMVLLCEDDVIRTSSLTKVTNDVSIDDAGIPTTKWQS